MRQATAKWLKPANQEALHIIGDVINATGQIINDAVMALLKNKHSQPEDEELMVWMKDILTIAAITSSDDPAFAESEPCDVLLMLNDMLYTMAGSKQAAVENHARDLISIISGMERTDVLHATIHKDGTVTNEGASKS